MQKIEHLDPLRAELYFQILHKAREINDSQLVELVNDKLYNRRPERYYATPTGCVIIKFPTPEPPAPAEAQSIHRWKGLLLSLGVFPGSFMILLFLTVFCT